MKPTVVVWFKVYCVIFCLMYFGVGIMGGVIARYPHMMEMSQTEALVVGSIFMAMGGFLFVGCLIPLLLRPQPWLWIYNLVIICLGMTSACILPASIALLIFWLKPETKAYFGRN